jgi:EpsI family protein
MSSTQQRSRPLSGSSQRASSQRVVFARLPWLPAAVLCASLVGTYVLAAAVTPKVFATGIDVQLEQSLPARFGVWQQVANPVAQVSVSTNATDPNMNQPYDQLVMRGYRNDVGQTIFLAVAWGESQRQEIKIHRPELCYPAQGYRVSSLTDTRFEGVGKSDAPVTGKRMTVHYGGTTDAVVYWIRIGSVFSDSAWETRGHIVREGLKGRIPDGILVRASMRTDGKPESLDRAFRQLEGFAVDLARAAPDAPLLRSTAELAQSKR